MIISTLLAATALQSAAGTAALPSPQHVNCVRGVIACQRAVRYAAADGADASLNDRADQPAADSSGTPSAQASTPSDGALQEIVVTAQRRQEREVDVPISITAVGGAQLAASGVKSLRELGQLVPAFRVDQSGGYSQPSLRGVGNAIVGPGNNPAVATYIDGFYQPSQVGSDIDPVAVSSIQVLKGPQGTLFGRNATGGALVINTEQPAFQPSIRATAGLGSYRDRHASVYATGPVTQNLAANLAVAYRENEGYVWNDFTGNRVGGVQKFTARAKLLWTPTDALSITLTGEHLYDRDDNRNTFSSFNGLNVTPLVVPGTTVVQSPWHVSLDHPTQSVVKAETVQLKVENDLGFARLTSYTQYRDEHGTQDIDFDATSAPFFANFSFPHQNTFTQEFNLASKPGGKLDWVLGAFYYNDRGGIREFNVQGLAIIPTAPDVAVPLFHDAYQLTKAYAVFADGTYNIGGGLFLTLGARYSIEDQTGRDILYGAPDRTNKQTFRSFTPRAVLRYNLAPNSNIYASFSKGFKSGGYAPTTILADPTKIPSFKPEKITAYEVGFKTRQGSFSAEGAVYYYDYTNQQVAFYTGNSSQTLNAAASRIYGAELQFRAQVTEQFTLAAGAAYNHARYKSFPAAPLITAFSPAPTAVDVSGRTLQRAPDFTGNVAAHYTVPIGEGKANFDADYYLTSDIPLEPTNTYIQKSYGILNGRASYTFPGDHVTVAVFGANLTNAKYVGGFLPIPGIAIFQQYGAPRTVGAEISTRF